MGEKRAYCSKCGIFKNGKNINSGYCGECKNERSKELRTQKRIIKFMALTDLRPKLCLVIHCDRFSDHLGYCDKHYQQMKLKGKVYESKKEHTYEYYKNNLHECCEPVTESGCWLWSKHLDKNGYGVFSVMTNGRKRTLKAHRLSYEIVNGSIPNDGHICHKCDIPTCINPKHLFLGATQDNTQDKVNKNRQVIGEDQKAAKLTDQDVLDIRASSEPYSELVARYNVSLITISRVRRRLSWKHVGDPN